MLAAWYIGAAVIGAAAGFAIGGIFRLVVPEGTNRRYWRSVGQSVRELIFGDETRFWANYRNVIRATAKYVVRQLFALLVAFAPLAALLIVVAPWILTYWSSGAPVAVYPAGAGILRQADGGEPSARMLDLSRGSVIPVPEAAGSFAVCPAAGPACLALQSIGFTTTVDPAAAGELVIVRATRNDWNPLWPYLNDPEFLFFATLSAVSLYAIFRPSRRKAPDESGHGVGAIDFVLTDIAVGRADFMYKLGNLESRLYARRLAAVSSVQPVFISGLARSGTTILLDRLAMLDEVATHRYRDFPFIMTPIFWHRFLTVFGRRQAPIERPHKDRIKITRESPDAFEEPIWQYFFGRSLEPMSANAVDASADERFRDFYCQHIRKILYLRKGSRYVSKGNYNILRMRFLLDIFPDASFLVPIRHPYTHVQSLVRQHELFSRYAEADPKVADYLRAVGHFEFGPQRMPLRFSSAGAAKTLAYWQAGNDVAGYAQQWSDVYGAVHELLQANDSLAGHIRLVYFEDLCRSPEEEFASILDFAGLSKPGAIQRLSQGIHPPSGPDAFDREPFASAWSIVAGVAGWFGYREDPA
ncbi:MAG: sulfotransferase, partial [Woeseiaceae bacterium]